MVAGMGVGDDCGQWLVHFMGNRGRKFGQPSRLTGSRKSVLRQTKLFLSPHLAIDVHADTIPLHNCTFVIAPWRRTRLDPAIFAIEAPSPVPARRSEERRVGEEGVSTCKSRGAPDH